MDVWATISVDEVITASHLSYCMSSFLEHMFNTPALLITKSSRLDSKLKILPRTAGAEDADDHVHALEPAKAHSAQQCFSTYGLPTDETVKDSG
jgi:hypothetical protein